jgi:WD40 repeat protein
MPVENETDLLLSASLDSTVRIWSLDKFQQLYIFQIPTNGLSFVKLYEEGGKVLIAESEQITVIDIHLILKNYLAVDA